MSKKKVIIIGGGFGGIKVALGLSKADIELTVIDKTNHHLFQPLLYQVATAAISETNITTPLREILRNQANATVIMNEVVAIDKENKTIRLLDGEILHFDSLIIAAGAITSHFGNNEWRFHAHGLKTVADAINLREHILFSFERAEKAETIEDVRKHLRFVIIGGGPTGVEMAGSIAEIANTAIFKNFRKISIKDAEIFLIEGGEYILPTYPKKLSIQAQKDLESMGVKVMTKTFVTEITKDGVDLKDKFLTTSNVIWAAGSEGVPLLKSLGTPLDRQARAIVEPDLSIAGYPDLFVIGDAASFNDPVLGVLPGVAQVAMQQGKYVAKIVADKIAREKRKPFKYVDKGSMATIGKAKAVVVIKKMTFSGVFAWLLWSFIHIAFLISFRNRFIVMTEWIFLYFTNRRNATTIIHNVDQIEKEHI